MGGKVRLFRRLGGHHRARAVGELHQQRGIRRFQVQRNLHRAGDLDRFNGGDLAFTQGAFQGQGAVEVVFCGGGIEFLTVVEGDAFAQIERQGFTVVTPRPVFGQAGDDLQVFIHVHQPVAQGGKDEAAIVGARQMRVEHVRVSAQADPQHAFRMGGQRRAKQHNTSQYGQKRITHCHYHEFLEGRDE